MTRSIIVDNETICGGAKVIGANAVVISYVPENFEIHAEISEMPKFHKLNSK